MTAVAGRTPTGKVWHVAVPVREGWTVDWVPLCADHRVRSRLRSLRDLATVPAYHLCQKCERASEQIAAAIREVQS